MGDPTASSRCVDGFLNDAFEKHHHSKKKTERRREKEEENRLFLLLSLT
jgi:hypothetical protein